MTELRNRPRGGLLGLHAQTPMHPGSGTALGTVDLPVQRERATGWPTVAGSALKGILRDACREALAGRDNLDELERFDDTRDEEGAVTQKAERRGSRRQKADATLELNAVFGPPAGSSAEFAGSLSVTDARLVGFPVRSLKGVFAWVTCPGVLDRLKRDADLAGLALPWAIPEGLTANNALVPPNCPCRVGDFVVLEEFQFTAKDSPEAQGVGHWLAANLLPDSEAYKATRKRLENQLVVLHDDDFTHFARHATEVLARVGLNYETKTVKEGALFYQEFLPAETLFYAVLLANPARARTRGVPDAQGVLTFVRERLPKVLQVGGDETTGKGYCATRLARAEGGA